LSSGSKDTAETLLGEELVEIVWERTRGTSSSRGSSAEEMGDEAGVREGVRAPASWGCWGLVVGT